MGYARKPVVAFAKKMEVRLKKNDHKGGWDTCTSDYLWGRALEELLELRDAMRDVENLHHSRDVRNEAADAANFLMMIFDTYGG